jgi:glycogen(starch) synthase
MKIWILSSEFPPHIGGIGTYVDNAARMFSSGGHEVTVLTTGGEPGETRETENLCVLRFEPRRAHVDDHVPSGTAPEQHPGFPFGCMSYWPALSYQFADQVVERIDRFGPPGAIEVQDYNAVGYFLLQRKLLGEPRLAEVPVVVQIHSPAFGVRLANKSPQYVLPDYWVGQMERSCLLSADSLLCPSAFLTNWLSRDEAALPPATVLPLPHAHAEPLARDPSEDDVVYVGRLEVRKGVIPLVEGCARLWKEGRTFRLTLVGEDRRYDPLGMPVGQYLKRRFAHHVEAGRLVFAGALAPAEVRDRIFRAWCTVVPSLWENYPYACIEAMSLGKVVLASLSGGQAEMIGDNDEAGVLFDWSRKGQFEDALVRVLAMSPQQNLEMGQRAAARIRGLTSYEAVLPQRLAHLENLLREAPPSRRLFPTVSPQPQAQIGPVEGRESSPGLLSVVIPYHNLGRYIEETLESVLSSTYRELEVLVVDDGSNDPESIAALEEIKRNAPHDVKIVHTEHQGICATRNMGASQSSGEFLAFVDGDDVVDAHFFARCIDVLRTYHNVGFVYSWISYLGETEGCWPSWNTEFPFFLAHNLVSPMAVTRRDLFLAYGKNKADMEYNLEDYDSWLGMVTKGYVGVSIPEVLAHYRVRRGSRLRGINRDQELHLYERIAQHHPEAYERYSSELFHLLNANGPAWGLVSPASTPRLTLAEAGLSALMASRGWRLAHRVSRSRVGLAFQRIARRLGYAFLANR